MTLPYLKLEPEQAVQELNTLMLEGYKLKDKLMSGYRALNGTTKQLTAIPIPPDTRAGWTEQIITWVAGTFQKLQEVYVTPTEAYKFKEVQAPPLSNDQFDDRFYGQLLKLQARIDILDEFKKFIFAHTSIQIVAGRDVNMQVAGTNNKQEVTNEGQ